MCGVLPCYLDSSLHYFSLHLRRLSLFPNAVDQEMRSFVGRFQIQGNEALKPMMMLSGGQKSRVAFAALAYQKPHVIIMDEPTNHRKCLICHILFLPSDPGLLLNRFFIFLSMIQQLIWSQLMPLWKLLKISKEVSWWYLTTNFLSRILVVSFGL